LVGGIVIVLVGLGVPLGSVAVERWMVVHQVCTTYPDVAGDRELFQKYSYPYPFLYYKKESMGGSPNYADFGRYIVGWSSRDSGVGADHYEYDLVVQTWISVYYDPQTGVVEKVDESGVAVHVNCGD
jgi:hypothetical protein